MQKSKTPEVILLSSKVIAMVLIILIGGTLAYVFYDNVLLTLFGTKKKIG